MSLTIFLKGEYNTGNSFWNKISFNKRLFMPIWNPYDKNEYFINVQIIHI